MRAFVRRIISFIEDWFDYKELKPEVVYECKKNEVLVSLEESNGLLKIYIKGLVFHFPLDMKKEIDEPGVYENIKKIGEANLDSFNRSELEIMLKEYELKEDYDMCSKIKNVLNTRE